MTKKQEYVRIAKAAGIKSPDVEYMCQRQAYRIGIMIPVPDTNTRRGVGFTTATVGVYVRIIA